MNVFMSRLLAAELCPYVLCNGGKPAGPAPADRHMPPEPPRSCEGGHRREKKELPLPALIGSRYDGACGVAPGARRRLCSAWVPRALARATTRGRPRASLATSASPSTRASPSRRAEGGEDDVTATRRTESIGRRLDCARGFRTSSFSRRADRGQSLVPGRAVPGGVRGSPRRHRGRQGLRLRRPRARLEAEGDGV